MPITTEIGRIVRHTIAPMVILAVDRGWIPEAAQHDVVELLTILVAIGAVYGVSWWRDKQKEARNDAGS